MGLGEDTSSIPGTQASRKADLRPCLCPMLDNCHVPTYHHEVAPRAISFRSWAAPDKTLAGWLVGTLANYSPCFALKMSSVYNEFLLLGKQFNKNSIGFPLALGRDEEEHIGIL